MWVKGELFDDLPAVAARFGERLSDTAQPNLFDRLSWLWLTHSQIHPNSKPLIAYAHAQGHDVWLFLMRQNRHHADGLGSWYTLAYRPIFSAGTPEEIKRPLLVAVARRLRKALGTIRLEPVPEGDGTKDLLVSAFRKAGWSATNVPKTGNWYTSVAGSDFDTFWKSRPGQVRSTHDRRLKKFPMDVEINRNFSGDLWQQYQAIFSESWKGEEGSAAFLRAMAEHQSSMGALRLGFARFEGVPVAAQLWTVDHGSAIIHKLAYRDDAAHMSPGTILSAAMFREAIDTDKVSLISYGTGDDGYKRDWMDQRDQLHIIEFFNPTSLTGLIGLIRSAVSRAARAITTRKSN